MREIVSIVTTAKQIPPLAVGTLDAARLIGVSADTVRDLVAHDELPHIRLTGKLLFRVTDLEAWLAKGVAIPVNVET